MFEVTPELKRAVLDRSPHFIDNAVEIVYEWKDFMVNMSHCAKAIEWNRPALVRPMPDGLGGVINSCQPNKFLMRLTDFVGHNPDLNPEDKLCTSHIYYSLNQDAVTNGLHKDTADVFIIGLLGNTSIKVEDKQWRIGRGDLIYIPRGIMHDTKPFQAGRALLSIGIEHGRN